MIVINEKSLCCGCCACVQACPKQCISFKEDEEGFRYPLVDKETCIDCGHCEKVCPMLNQSAPKKPINVYAAINPNEEVKMKSSSGGIFSMLAEQIINEGGVVFGARFDENWDVKHNFTETIEGLEVFRGSKYLQSRIGETYKQTSEFLKKGRKVLYSGTSCQIAGLKKFLCKDYENLFTVDVVCHGVPSPKIWQAYLRDINPNAEKVSYVNQRAKTRGWKKYSYVIKSENSVLFDDYAANSMYLKGFMNNVFLRPSCYNCPAKNGKSNSDITLADCWGYWDFAPDKFDDKGVSAVLINTNKGENYLRKVSSSLEDFPFDLFLKNNLSYSNSSQNPKYRDYFWKEFPLRGLDVINSIENKLRPSIFRRFQNKIFGFLRRFYSSLLK